MIKNKNSRQMQIPVFTPLRQYFNLKEEIDRAIQKVLNSGKFILGDEVAEFESSVARYLGVKHAIGVASGTDALQIALMSIGLKPGDEVITTPFTFVATAETIALLGGKPVYVDVDEETFNINPEFISDKITSRTRAIIPVHLYGQTADMDEIKEVIQGKDIFIIEDSAQAFGAEYKGRKAGSMGDIACISFFPTKNLGAFGDAGMVVTNNDELAEKIKMIRTHGSNVKYHHKILGINSRLDTIQAAILLVKLKYIDRWNQRRMEIAGKYNELLKDISNIEIPHVRPYNKHVFHQYTIRIKNSRDELREFLRAEGIQTAVHYPIPLHLQEAFKSFEYRKGDFPISEKLSKEVLSLPMFPELRDEEIEYISAKLHEFFENKAKRWG
jgi:dTDP-4-amino-4,6-dideoxygalactose transaminase